VLGSSSDVQVAVSLAKRHWMALAAGTGARASTPFNLRPVRVHRLG
jgi:hypothetical protein